MAAADDADTGPVRRSSVREMAHLWTPSNLTAQLVDGKVQASETGYGFGLRVTSDCRFEHIVAHGGGLPGFGIVHVVAAGVRRRNVRDGHAHVFGSIGTDQRWRGTRCCAPAGCANANSRRRRGRRRCAITSGICGTHWGDAEAKQIAAVNFFLDAPAAQRQAEIRALKNEVGECTDATPVMPENWMRGQFNMTCANGTVGVFFTLAPTQPPAMQHLAFQKLASPTMRMGAPTGAPAGVSCTP